MGTDLRLFDYLVLLSTAIAVLAVLVVASYYAWHLRRAAGWQQHARDWHIALIGCWAVSRMVRSTVSFLAHPGERDWRAGWEIADNLLLYVAMAAVIRVVVERIQFERRRDRRSEDRA